MIDILEQRITALEARVTKLEAKPSVPNGGTVADDGDLDGQWGDPVVRKDPPRWKGQSWVGSTYSACPSDFLTDLAGFLDWCSKKEATTPGKEKYSAYSAKDAARARGWAKRNAGQLPVGQPLPATKNGPQLAMAELDKIIEDGGDIPF